MKKIILSFISILLLLTVFFACKDEISNKDKSQPTISNIKVNWGRPIRIVIDSLDIDTTVITNMDTLDLGEEGWRERVDTLILKDSLLFSAYLSDDYKLSTLMLRIYKEGKPTIEEANGDTAFYRLRVWTNMYGKKDTIINNLNAFYIPDIINKNVDGTNVRYPVATGEYNLRVIFFDTFGKGDSVVHKVYIQHRDSLLK